MWQSSNAPLPVVDAETVVSGQCSMLVFLSRKLPQKLIGLHITPTGQGNWRLTWQEMAIVVTHSGYDVPSQEEIKAGVQYSIFLGPLSIWATRWKPWISVNGERPSFTFSLLSLETTSQSHHRYALGHPRSHQTDNPA